MVSFLLIENFLYLVLLSQSTNILGFSLNTLLLLFRKTKDPTCIDQFDLSNLIRCFPLELL